MSLVSWETPWKPATMAIAPSRIAASIRPGVMSMILALPCAESVITPAWVPVNDLAVCPSWAIAIATSAIEIRSPAVSSMSSSRGGGSGDTCSARSMSSSVVSPMAETTTTTSLPERLASTIRCATRLTPSASPTEEPPYFCTTMPTESPGMGGWDAPHPTGGHRPSPARAAAEWTPRPPLRAALTCAQCTAQGAGSVVLGGLQHLLGRLDGVLLTLELRVEPVVGDHRLQGPQRPARLPAPRGDVGELPPPQRL